MRLDDLYLWYLGDATPRYVGALKLAAAGKGISLHYSYCVNKFKALCELLDSLHEGPLSW